jgi:hypothetical protein
LLLKSNEIRRGEFDRHLTDSTQFHHSLPITRFLP